MVVCLLSPCASPFSSPEPKAHRRGYMIGMTPSSVIVVVHTLQTSSQKLLGQSNSNFKWSFLGIREWTFAQMIRVTWSKWLPCPYMVKWFKNLLRWNRMAGVVEIWFIASGTRVLLSLLKCWHCVHLWPFYGKFGPICFCMGKKVKQWIFQKLL